MYCNRTSLGDSQKRKFAPILIITGLKKLISLCANKHGIVIQMLGDFVKMTDTRLESLIVTRVESCDSSGVFTPSFFNVTRIESPKILTRVNLFTQNKLSLVCSIGLVRHAECARLHVAKCGFAARAVSAQSTV